VAGGHPPHGLPAAQDGAEHVHGQHALHPLRGQLVEPRPPAHDAGVGDQPGHRPQAVRGIERGQDVVLDRHVRADGERGPTGILDAGDDRRGRGLVVPVREGDRPPGGSRGTRGRRADAAAPVGQEEHTRGHGRRR
jgi:hypothetical protein